MRSLFVTFCLLAVLSSFTSAADKKDEDTFKVAGKFTIAAPAPGFKWEKVRDVAQGKLTATMYLAQKENSAARVVLINEHRKVDTDQRKSDSIRGAYDGLLDTLKETGTTEIKASRPSLKPPIPNRVSYLMTGKKDGADIAYAGAVVFGNEVYQFQVIATSPDEAKKLIKVAESLKEEGSSSEKSADKSK